VNEEVKSTAALREHLFRTTLAELCEAVQGTDAQSVIDPGSERTASSTRSVSTSYLKPLQYIKDTKDPFSLSK
jgi:hypothetical protein